MIGNSFPHHDEQRACAAAKSDMDLFAHSERLDVQMPIEFSNGFNVMHMKIACAACGKQLGPKRVRARIGRFGEHMAVVNIFGFCKTCRCLTKNVFRINDASEISYLSNGLWHNAGTMLPNTASEKFKSTIGNISESLLAGLVGLAIPWPGAVMFVMLVLWLLHATHHLP